MKRETNERIYTIYLDSSVIGGYFDDEFSIHTRILFNKFKNGIYKPTICKKDIKY